MKALMPESEGNVTAVNSCMAPNDHNFLGDSGGNP